MGHAVSVNGRTRLRVSVGVPKIRHWMLAMVVDNVRRSLDKIQPRFHPRGPEVSEDTDPPSDIGLLPVSAKPNSSECAPKCARGRLPALSPNCA
eukprot:8808000-Pyramimonas_sp.AAC.1